MIRWYVGDRCVLAELQHPDVGRNQPSIAYRNLLGVALHRAEAVRDHVEEVADAFLAQPIVVIARGLTQTTLHHHAVAVTEPSVTRRAVDIESLLAALELFVADG